MSLVRSCVDLLVDGCAVAAEAFEDLVGGFVPDETGSGSRSVLAQAWMPTESFRVVQSASPWTVAVEADLSDARRFTAKPVPLGDAPNRGR